MTSKRCSAKHVTQRIIGGNKTYPVACLITSITSSAKRTTARKKMYQKTKLRGKMRLSCFLKCGTENRVESSLEYTISLFNSCSKAENGIAVEVKPNRPAARFRSAGIGSTKLDGVNLPGRFRVEPNVPFATSTKGLLPIFVLALFDLFYLREEHDATGVNALRDFARLITLQIPPLRKGTQYGSETDTTYIAMQNLTVIFFTHANFCDNECESPNAVRDILAKSVDLIYVFSYKFLHVPEEGGDILTTDDLFANEGQYDFESDGQRPAMHIVGGGDECFGLDVFHIIYTNNGHEGRKQHLALLPPCLCVNDSSSVLILVSIGKRQQLDVEAVEITGRNIDFRRTSCPHRENADFS
ncbi:hypothetical protein EAG_11830 [Camponotus floridanus]|uniref:Uncharacterized protein n=1 Tax=Camponotus floridanus TaxID=104421 RepID=E2AA62_CAMFO|nr:hypothetical protein EAG_11830 [Camponotus floridanus]